MGTGADLLNHGLSGIGVRPELPVFVFNRGILKDEPQKQLFGPPRRNGRQLLRVDNAIHFIEIKRFVQRAIYADDQESEPVLGHAIITRLHKLVADVVAKGPHAIFDLSDDGSSIIHLRGHDSAHILKDECSGLLARINFSL